MEEYHRSVFFLHSVRLRGVDLQQEEYHRSVFVLCGVRLQGVDLQHGGVPEVSIFLARSETPGSGPAAWRSTTGQ
jgi:hypothetical protein